MGLREGRTGRLATEQDSKQDLVGMKWACPDGPQYQRVTEQGNLDA